MYRVKEAHLFRLLFTISHAVPLHFVFILLDSFIIHQLISDIECKVGEYLPLGGASCKTCELGTFSLGGGIRIFRTDMVSGQSLSALPLELTTQCVSTRSLLSPSDPDSEKCTGWKLGDGFISSGSTVDGHVSVLTAAVEIKASSGAVRFTYRVDAEANFDGLFFEVDGTAKLGGRSSLISSQVQDATASFPLSQGLHLLTWGFQKDFSRSEGEDKAILQVNSLFYFLACDVNL